MVWNWLSGFYCYAALIAGRDEDWLWMGFLIFLTIMTYIIGEKETRQNG